MLKECSGCHLWSERKAMPEQLHAQKLSNSHMAFATLSELVVYDTVLYCYLYRGDIPVGFWVLPPVVLLAPQASSPNSTSIFTRPFHFFTPAHNSSSSTDRDRIRHEQLHTMDSVIDSALIEAEKEHVATAQKRKGEKAKSNPSRKRLEFDFAKQVC